MKTKPTVGQILYSLNVNDACRRSLQVLVPTKVTKVGNKYFTCNHTDYEHGAKKYRLDNWMEVVDYGSTTSELYVSELEYAEKKEATAICKEFGDAFCYGANSQKVSLNNLRLMREIMNSSNPSKKMISETGPEVSAYLRSLKAGEEVVETGASCMTGIKGVVYESTSGGGTCVRWNTSPQLGTGVTHGTRRLSDVPTGFKVKEEPALMS